jgi:hypothetical protein
MKWIKISLIILAFLFANCKDGGGVNPAGTDESLFLAFKGGAFNFRSIEVIHDRNESLLFFYDAFLKKAIIYNYSTRKAFSKGQFAINQDGYADLGYAYFNGKPEIYIPHDTKVEVFNMRDLESPLSINTGHLVSGISVSGNIISVGYCDRSIETYDRKSGSPISSSDHGHLCEKVESGLYLDTLRVIGFPTTGGTGSFMLNNHYPNGKYISERTVASSLIFNPLIRVSESGSYFVTSDRGHVYSFSGKYIGQLSNSGGSFRDYSFSSDGDIIYALLANGNIQRISYPSLEQIGETFIKEDDVKWVPERIFTNDQNLIRIYNLANSSSSTEIHLKIVPLDRI